MSIVSSESEVSSTSRPSTKRSCLRFAERVVPSQFTCVTTVTVASAKVSPEGIVAHLSWTYPTVAIAKDCVEVSVGCADRTAPFAGAVSSTFVPPSIATFDGSSMVKYERNPPFIIDASLFYVPFPRIIADIEPDFMLMVPMPLLYAISILFAYVEAVSVTYNPPKKYEMLWNFEMPFTSRSSNVVSPST